MPDFVYDLPRLLRLHEAEQELSRRSAPALLHLATLPAAPRALGVLAGSFNPLTNGHEALVDGARREGIDSVLLLLPLRAIDKEAVARASAVDRALVLTEWAARRAGVGVALTNRGLYVEQAALLAEHYPSSRIVFVVGHDKIVQIFDPRYYTDRDGALRDLFGRAAFRVAPRAGRGATALRGLLEEQGNAPFASGVAALDIDTDVDALSSTIVRERARQGEPWESLTPPEPARFIRETEVYATSHRLPDGEELDPYGLRLAILHGVATGRLGLYPDTFERLYREARAETEEGRWLRAWLANDVPRYGSPITVDRPVEALIEKLGDEDRHKRLHAAQALGFRYAAGAVGPLIQALGDADIGVADAARDSLVTIGEPAVSPLIRALQDEAASTERRVRAVAALGGIKDKRAFDPLLRTLQARGEDRAVRAAVAFYLGGLRDARAVGPLIAMVQDAAEDPNVRGSAAETLGTLGAARGVKPLLAVLQNPHEDVDVRRRAIMAFGHAPDPRAITPMVDKLASEDSRERGLAAWVLGKKYGGEHVLDLLLTALHSDSSRQRVGAVQALWWLPEARVLAPLRDALQHDADGAVRAGAAGALGRAGDAESVGVLADALMRRDEESLVREAAANALRHVPDDRALDALLRALADGDAAARYYSIRSLGARGDARALPALEKVRQDTTLMASDYVAEAVAHAIGTIKRRNSR